jgi:acyl carrier protein
MTSPDIRANIKAAMKSVGTDFDDDDSRKNYLSEYGMDSMATLAFFMALNELCDVEIPEGFVEQDWKITDLIQQISSLQK